YEGLSQHTIGLDELVLPIFARLSDVNRTDEPFVDELVRYVQQGRSLRFAAFVRGKLASSRCTILLDAWDEVPVEIPPQGQLPKFETGYRQRLKQRLEIFVNSQEFTQCRLFITSRIVGYNP